jgi:phage nucleotide-binding protein
MLIYGASGAGKTSLAKTIKEKCLIISAESGLLSLSDYDIDVVDIADGDPLDRWAKVLEIFHFLKRKETAKTYDWIFIDSLTEIAQILVARLKKKYPEKKDSLPMWGEYNDSIRGLIKSFRDLKGYHVVMTALQSLDKDEFGARFYGVDINGKVSNQVDSFFDEVFHLKVFEDDEGNTKRALITQRTGDSVGKDRSGKLNPMEPCDLNHIKTKIVGE